MAFTAKDVAALRERTSCGMMDCKKALTETNGDMEAAIDLLREKGLAAAAKKAGRIAAEGIVVAKLCDCGKIGVVLEVNSETDFVAKNQEFLDFVDAIADTIIDQNPDSVEALAELNLAGTDEKVEKARQDKILTIGENIKIRRFIRKEGTLVTYVHGGGRIGVMVQIETDAADQEAVTEMGKDVAMQIAALNAGYLNRESVPAEVLEKEKAILMEQIKNEPKNAGKPEQIVQKMVEGRVKKYYEQNCLLEQEFVKDSAFTVGGFVEDCAKKLGAAIQVTDFVRYEKGEGLQKREDNFADEVAGMIG